MEKTRNTCENLTGLKLAISNATMYLPYAFKHDIKKKTSTHKDSILHFCSADLVWLMQTTALYLHG